MNLLAVLIVAILAAFIPNLLQSIIKKIESPANPSVKGLYSGNRYASTGKDQSPHENLLNDPEFIRFAFEMYAKGAFKDPFLPIKPKTAEKPMKHLSTEERNFKYVQILAKYYKDTDPKKLSFDGIPEILREALESEDVKSIVTALRMHPYTMKQFPFLVSYLVSLIVKETEMSDFDVAFFSKFFYDYELFRDFAVLYELKKFPLKVAIFKPFDWDQNARLFDYLFIVSPQSVLDFFQDEELAVHFSSSLILTNQYDIEVMKQCIAALENLYTSERVMNMIALGIAKMDLIEEKNYHLFERNSVLIDELERIMRAKKVSSDNFLKLKALKVIHETSQKNITPEITNKVIALIHTGSSKSDLKAIRECLEVLAAGQTPEGKSRLDRFFNYYFSARK